MRIDALWWPVVAVCVLVLVGAQAVLLRDALRHQRSERTRSALQELLWTAVPALLLVALLAFTLVHLS